jgi:hypothetical protein
MKNRLVRQMATKPLLGRGVATDPEAPRVCNALDSAAASTANARHPRPVTHPFTPGLIFQRWLEGILCDSLPDMGMSRVTGRGEPIINPLSISVDLVSSISGILSRTN